MIELQPDERILVERADRLARECFAGRAERHDREASFPADDFDDLFAAGLLAAAVPAEHGGGGLGLRQGKLWALWQITRALARADLSLARCWEGHCNSLLLIDGLGSAEQQRRWFAGVRDAGERWVAWSGEPQSRAPGEVAATGTRLSRVSGGWVIEGSKVFATSAGAAQRAILLINAEGPGGARHAVGAPESLLLLACDLRDPSVSVDTDWWDPIGMRATVSHRVRFDRTFVAEADSIGAPGQYLRDGWQTAFAPHYAASFLGAAEAANEWALACIAAQGKAGDPYVQSRCGQMAVDLETAQLWLAHVAGLWALGRVGAAQQAGVRARYMVEHLAAATVDHAVRVCGARSLLRPSPVERIVRDLTLYLRHDNADHILATIGKAALGVASDPSFYRP